MDTMKIFVERLNDTLQERGFSQRELARQTSIPLGSVNRYCNGENEPTIGALAKICKALDESADYLIGLKDD